MVQSNTAATEAGDSAVAANGRIRMTAGQALVRFLAAQYSERDGETERLIPAVFGIFGHGNVTGIGHALNELSALMPFYQPKNEQSMVHTALGFARTMLRKATFACTSSIGPGATNMLTGAATAATNRLPVLLLPADYYASRLQGPALQQLEHPISGDISANDAFRPLSRYFDRVQRAEQLLDALPRAMRTLTDPADVGPVTLSIPQDVGTEAYDYPARFFDRRVWRIERRSPDAEAIRMAVELIAKARRPAIIAGGGVHYSEAWAELEEFSSRLGIPVGETRSGKGSVRIETPLLLGATGISGTPPAGEIMREADLVICVGTRLTDFVTGSRTAFQDPNVRFLNINVARYDASKHRGLAIIADARETLRQLTLACADAGVRPIDDYVSKVTRQVVEWISRLDKEVFKTPGGARMTGAQLVHILNEHSRSGDVIVGASGATSGDLHKLWDATGGRRCHLEFGFSCMGYEIPGGIGVRMAQAGGEVVVLIGDGTYLMSPSEIVTAGQEGLKITIVISDNGGHQVIRKTQVARTGHTYGTEFRRRDVNTGRPEGEYVPVDFVKNAESLGARAWLARTPDDLHSALAEARDEAGVSVVVVPTERQSYPPDSGVWFDVAPPAVSEDPVTIELRAEYEVQRKQQRSYS